MAIDSLPGCVQKSSSWPAKNKELLIRMEGLIANRERVFDRARQVVLDLERQGVGGGEKPEVHREKDAFLQKLHRVMENEIDLSTVSLDKAAAAMAMSKRSFQREMQRTGMSWREYRQLRRLRAAMDLLRDPANRIGMVAEKTGYSSAAHFSRIFKQQTGMSPTRWKGSRGIG